MSLIVAKKHNNGVIQFFSDTKVSIESSDKSVTGGNKLRLSPISGILKTYILSDRIIISFAGEVEKGCEIIKSLLEEKPLDIPNFILNKLENNKTDFLIGLNLDEKKNPLLLKIKHEGITECNKTGWIGDNAAFNEFQEYFNSDKMKEIPSEEQRFSASFADFIEYCKTPSVGDFLIEAVYTPTINAFYYRDRLMSHSGSLVISLKANIPQVLSEGAIPQGSYMVANLVSNNTGKPAVALFFDQANFGILFISKKCFKTNGIGEVFTNLNRSEFLKEVDSRYGIKLMGPSFTNGRFGFSF